MRMIVLLCALIVFPQVSFAGTLSAADGLLVIDALYESVQKSSLKCSFLKKERLVASGPLSAEFNWSAIYRDSPQVYIDDGGTQPVIVVRFHAEPGYRESISVTTNPEMTDIVKFAYEVNEVIKTKRNVGTLTKPVFKEEISLKRHQYTICQ